MAPFDLPGGDDFHQYFSDRRYGSPQEALAAAEVALAEVRDILDHSKRVNGKLSATSVKKITRMLEKS